MIIKNRKPEIYKAKVNLSLLFLRVISGGFMLTHGIPKIFKVIQGPPFEFSDPIGMGVTASILLTTFAEVICAGFIITGFFTRLATIPLLITMAVAAFIVHAPDPFFAKEMPLLYLSIFLVIAILGPGGYSVDRFINLKKR
jgi:putative oxidoreductase